VPRRLALAIIVCFGLAVVPAGGSAEPAPTDDAAIVALALRDAARSYPDAAGAFEPAAVFHGPSGATHVRLHQRVDGLLVDDVELRLAFDVGGRLIHRSGTPAPSGTPATATLTAMQAMRIGAQTAGVPQPPTALSPSAGPERETSFARGTFIQPPSARLVLVSEAGTLRPAWKLSLPASFHQWHTTLVDARTGAIVRDVNVAAAAGPVGNIFVDDPDDGPPVAAEFAGALPGARAVWSDGGLTAGNNAVAGADRDGDGTPVLTTIAEHPFSDAYETTAGADELADVDAAANNAFYWINVAHDRFY
jgi:hypothetical protein